MARPNSNECSNATALASAGCAAALQELANATVPIFSSDAGPCWCCCAGGRNVTASSVTAIAIFIVGLPRADYTVAICVSPQGAADRDSLRRMCYTPAQDVDHDALSFAVLSSSDSRPRVGAGGVRLRTRSAVGL